MSPRTNTVNPVELSEALKRIAGRGAASDLDPIHAAFFLCHDETSFILTPEAQNALQRLDPSFDEARAAFAEACEVRRAGELWIGDEQGVGTRVVRRLKADDSSWALGAFLILIVLGGLGYVLVTRDLLPFLHRWH